MLKNFFKKKEAAGESESRGSEDILALARDVETAVDKLVNRIYNLYRNTLVEEDITYVVPAVWGAVKEGRLTDVQSDINKLATPLLLDMDRTLNMKGLSPSQEFAVQYILRSLVISKVIYMIEATRRHRAEEDRKKVEDQAPLEEVEPWGTA